jgi:hypothetical protein
MIEPGFRRRLLAPVLVGLAAALLFLIVGAASGASGPGSLSMGPQAMEGDLKVAPGTSLLVGYDFTIPGNHPQATVSFLDAGVTFQATCVTGAGQGTIVVVLADASYTDPVNSSAWYPSGDQHNASVYQGTTSIPDLCNGGLVRLQQGGTFTATIASTETSDKVNVRWHYSANGSSGSWSGTRGVLPVTPPSNGGE